MRKVEDLSKFYYSGNDEVCFIVCQFITILRSGKEYTTYLLQTRSTKLNIFLDDFKIDQTF